MAVWFLSGGVLGMSILTLLLLALLLAAWKAPAWVKEIGLIALVAGLLNCMLGLYQAAGVVAITDDISPRLLWGAFQVALIPIIYGVLIYVASLIIRIVHKPRI